MRIVLLLLAAALAAGAQETIAIAGATVVDGTGAPPRPATVIVRGERILAVTAPDAAPPAGARVIRAEGYTLLPGLFDLHTHIPYASAPGTPADWGKHVKQYLLHGVTTAIDLGTYAETFEPMRRLIAKGIVEGPRIALACRLTTPGGHGGDGGRGDFFSQEVFTPQEGRAAVQRVLPYRPDVIKVFADGWRYDMGPDMTSIQEPALKAIVEEAHRNNIPVLTHTVTLERAKQAARAGVDIVGHGIGNARADEEVARLMREHGTTYVPTLSVYEPRRAAAPGTPGARRWDNLLHNVSALRAWGVTVGAGTDAGMTGTHHGSASLHELELLVKGGLTPLEAITAATGTAARALRVAAERGTVTEGKLADLVLVEGAPYRDIADIRNVRRVFLGGREIDRERLAREIAAPGPTPLPALKAAARIDDFEAERSSVDTRWLHFASDNRHEPVSARTLRGPRNHAFTVVATMGESERPWARVSLPLSRGAVEPVDARNFRRIRFSARGDGEYRLIVNTRSGGRFVAPFRADPRWSGVTVPFASFRAEGGTAQWSGADLLMISFEIARGPGVAGWLELDDIALEK